MESEGKLVRNEARNTQSTQNNGEFCAAPRTFFFVNNHDDDEQDIIDNDHTCEMYFRQLT